jgi:MFS family permease
VIVALNLGGSWGLLSPWLIGTLAVSLLLIVCFIAIELHRGYALIDVNLFRNRAFSAGNVAGLLSYAVLFGMFFLMPFAFERGYSLSSLESGLRLAVIPLGLAAVAPISGRISDRVGPYWPTLLGMAVSCLGLLLVMAWLNGAPSDLFLVTCGLGVFGLGQGLFIAPNNSAIMAAAPLSEMGQAGGVLNVMRSLGTSAGVALATSLLSWQLAKLTGRPGDTLHAPQSALLASARVVIAVFAGSTILAAIAATIGSRASSPPTAAGLATNNLGDSQL